MSRESMLAAIRQAAAGIPAPPPVVRDYARTGTHAPGSDAVIELLVDRLVDYKARVRVIGRQELAQAVSESLGAARSVVIPPGLPAAARAGAFQDGRSVVVDGEPEVLTNDALDGIAAVVTNARVAIALTGTIVLDGAPDQGRRAISLVPDLHVVILDAAQVVESVPEGVALLNPVAPLTLISGPSATSDIELIRVEGVHGPRTLDVLIVRD